MRVLALQSFIFHEPRLVNGEPQEMTVKFRGADVKTPMIEEVFVEPGAEIDVSDEVGRAVVKSGAAEVIDGRRRKGRAAQDAEDAALA